MKSRLGAGVDDHEGRYLVWWDSSGGSRSDGGGGGRVISFLRNVFFIDGGRGGLFRQG